MDIKMGTRTYLKNEVELWSKKDLGQVTIFQPKNLIPREDLFQKMVETDHEAPLLEEVKQQAVTKER